MVRERLVSLSIQKQWVDIKFELGIQFTDAEAFKHTVTCYEVANRFKLRFMKNHAERVTVECKKGCPFYVNATCFI